MGPDLARFSKGYFTPQARYRGRRPFSWLEWTSSLFEATSEIPLRAKRARVRRKDKSLRGIGDRKALRILVARNVDQGLLEEIATLDNLERLHLEYPIKASSLQPLTRLASLNFLSVEYPHRVADFSPLANIIRLRSLFIVDARQMDSLDWLKGANGLRALGAEGGLWRRQRIPTLNPLRGLQNLEALFLTGVTLEDRSLAPLVDCPSLRLLECGPIAPSSEFADFARLRPDVECERFATSVDK